MMIKGLSNTEEEFLFENLVNPLKRLNCKVYVFGSRATGRQQRFSDIDLLYVRKDKLENHVVYKLLQSLEDSNFAYKVDLVDQNELAESYRERIDTEKIEL